MNEEMQLKVLEYLQGMESRLGKAEDFVLEQAPLYVQELLAWEFWLSAILASVAGCALIPILCVAIAGYRIKKRDELDWKLESVLFGTIASILALAICVIGTARAVKVCVAPRVVVVEKLTGADK